MLHVAQTNLQLYNQLRAKGWSLEDLGLVRRAYDLSRELYSGFYQADGKPFVAHSVGVASIVAGLGLPPLFVTAALLHNVYGNGDFGDGLGSIVTGARRARVAGAVGMEIERLLVRFRDVRVDPATLRAIEHDFDMLDEDDRQLITIDLADYYEKYVDEGVSYFGDSSWIAGRSNADGERFVALARRLGHPALADALAEAFAEAGRRPLPPAELRGPPGQRFMAQTLSPSAHLRRYPEFRRWLRALPSDHILRRMATALRRKKRQPAAFRPGASPESVSR